jgi:hypothetical protein
MYGNNAPRAVKRTTKGGVFVTHSMCKLGIQLPQHLPGRKFQVKFHCDETIGERRHAAAQYDFILGRDFIA